jgi:hypothetical protein
VNVVQNVRVWRTELITASEAQYQLVTPVLPVSVLKMGNYALLLRALIQCVKMVSNLLEKKENAVMSVDVWRTEHLTVLGTAYQQVILVLPGESVNALLPFD